MPIRKSTNANDLRSLSIFEDLTDAQLDKLATITAVQDIPEGGYIVRQGEPANEVRVIVEGKANLCLELAGGREQCLLTMTAGEIIGWSALLKQPAWLASAHAIKDTTVLVFDATELRTLCEVDHELGYHLMRNLFAAVGSRLQDTRLQLLDMYGQYD